MKRLESLADADFEMPTLAASIWVPLVFVAWADGNADALKKKGILEVLAMTILKHSIVRCILVKIAKCRIVEAGLMKQIRGGLHHHG